MVSSRLVNALKLATGILVVFCLLLPGLVFAQEVASITGVVTDKTGAVIPNAKVTLLNTRTNALYEATTNEIGAYTLVKLPPGPGYQLTVDHEGFSKLTISDIYLEVQSTRTQNAELEVGGIAETVIVKAEGLTVNTADATIGNNFDMNMVHELPIQIRDSPAALLGLQPGVVFGIGGSDDPNSSVEGAVTGARADQGNITVDGLDANDFATQQAFATVANAPVESIQEFRGETGNPLASSGRGSGAQIQMVTKSGTNAFHGSVWEANRNTSFEANSFFNNEIGLQRPKLIRNQYGFNIGGPVKKNKLFFFFDYDARRDAREDSVLRTVPLDHVRNGSIAYINNGAGCTGTSRMNTQPNCITILTPGQTAALDPQGVGADSALLTLIGDRYPQANDFTAGDGVNTGGFRFNAPVSRLENNYVGRVDYTINNNMKVFGRFNMVHNNVGDDANFSAPVQFPGDPITHTISDNSYSYVVGHTWTISPNAVNQFIYGETRQDLGFPTLFNPAGTTVYSVTANNGSGSSTLSAPFSNQASQGRIVPIPEVRDDFSLTKGKHNLQFGGTFKTIKTRSNLTNDFNYLTLGLGGNLANLDASLRPADIVGSSRARSIWDSFFSFDLGRIGEVDSQFNYNRDLNPLANGTGEHRHYRYRETEIYAQDTWKLRRDLTVTYGLRYQYYSVPYETDGLEATPDVAFNNLVSTRIAAGAAGISGPDVSPILSYDLAGKVNNAPGLYKPDYKDFSPRLAFAYNPSFQSGVLGHLLGDHKTVIRAGGTMLYDHVALNAVNFVQDQVSYLFQNSVNTPFGTGDATSSLQTDPRFTGVTELPPLPAAPPITRPFQPFVDPVAGPIGSGLNTFNYTVDKNFKTPYAITMSLGFQRELPSNFLIEVDYFGRLGRRLFAEADAGQVVDFLDTTSNQTLLAAWAQMVTQVRAGSAVTPQPFFENQCFAGCTALVASALNSFVFNGDLADTIWLMDANGLLSQNVGLSGQFDTNAYITNKGSSNYHGLLVTLRKRMTHNLQFDVNYTYSHAIDNVSTVTNTVANGLICDVTNLRVCRGNSDFDIRHIITADYVYALPLGHGQKFGDGVPGWLNQIIGGWELAGVTTWHTGLPFTVVSEAFPISFVNDAPAIFNGDSAAVATKLANSNGSVQYFADPDAADAAFRGPLGLEAGQRNYFRGPHYNSTDLGLRKNFPIREGMKLQFRADAFNVFNHPSFSLPNSDFTQSTGNFGQITSTASTARVFQVALRFDF